MNNADVQQVVAQAASRGIAIAEYEAIIFLGAKELLAREPENKSASEVVQNFMTYMATGHEPWSFAKFMLPEFLTDEEIAEHQRTQKQ